MTTSKKRWIKVCSIITLIVAATSFLADSLGIWDSLSPKVNESNKEVKYNHLPEDENNNTPIKRENNGINNKETSSFIPVSKSARNQNSKLKESNKNQIINMNDNSKVGNIINGDSN